MVDLGKRVPHIVEQMIKQGYGLDPKDLLNEINIHIQAGTPLPNHLRAYFQNAIQSGDLNKGFGLKHSRQKGALDRFMRDSAIYQAYLDSDSPIFARYVELSEDFDLEHQTIEKIIKKMEAFLKN
jgi:hypothetical protein